MLTLQHGRLRLVTATALRKIGAAPKPAVQALIALLDGPDQQLVREAVLALGRFGPAAAPAVGPLAEVVRSREVGAQYLAAEALGRIGRWPRQQSPPLWLH